MLNYLTRLFHGSKDVVSDKHQVPSNSANITVLVFLTRILALPQGSHEAG